MKISELEDVIGIILTADGGCTACVFSLLKLLAESFPEWSERIVACTIECYKDDYDYHEEDIRKMILGD